MLVVGGPDPASGLGRNTVWSCASIPSANTPGRGDPHPGMGDALLGKGRTLLGHHRAQAAHPPQPPRQPHIPGAQPHQPTVHPPRMREALAQQDKTVHCPAWGPGLAVTVYWQPPVQRTWVLASKEAAMQTNPAWPGSVAASPMGSRHE